MATAMLGMSGVCEAEVRFLNPGSDDTFTLEVWNQIFNTVTSDSTQANTGPRSIKCDSAATNDQAFVVRSGNQPTSARVSVYVRFDSAPSTTAAILRLSGAQGDVILLQLNTSRQLVLLGTTGTATLSTNTWYRIALSYTITNTTTNEFRVFVNGGTPDISVSNATLGAATVSSLSLGWYEAPGANKVIWIDDVYVDDSTALTDPGDIHVTAKLPSAENTNSFDTAIGNARGSADYNNVNERPLSISNGWSHNANSGGVVSENYGIQAAAAGDVDISSATLVSRCAWVHAERSGASGTSNVNLYNNGTQSAISLTTTPALNMHCVDSATYPSDVAAVGMTSTGTSIDTLLYECGMVIAYTPAATARRMMIIE